MLRALVVGALLGTFGALVALGPAAPEARAVIGDALGLSPYWDWKTIETEHFRVTFPDELESIARRAAGHLEVAHEILTRKFRWTPSLRTQVLVIDNADAANGLASAVERLGIVLLVTPPDDLFSTARYEDWLRLVCFHEYTHLVNMDTTPGIVYQVLRYIIGDVLMPNSLWPTWMLEGLAVYMETRLTAGGRGRSPYYEMVLRAAVEEGVLDDPRFMTLDRVNGEYPYAPAGEIPYLFGYQLMNQVAKSPAGSGGRTADGEHEIADGEDALGLMSLRSGWRVPYFINGNLENITGKDWHRHWDEWVAETHARATTQLERIRSRSVTKIDRLTEGGSDVYAIAVSPDGRWLATTRESPDRRAGLYLRDLRDGTERRLRDKILGAGAAFTADSSALVFSRLERRSSYYVWSDLAIYELERERFTNLTDGLRARDPDVAADGRVVFTRTELGTTGLALGRLVRSDSGWRLESVQDLFRPAPLGRASHPRFTPDGKRVVFSLHENGKSADDLMELTLASGPTPAAAPRALVSDGRYNRHPRFAPNGDLTYVSDASGVDNFYRLAAGKSSLATNVTTGVRYPTFAPDGTLYAAAYSTRGWDLAKLEAKAPPDAAAVSIDPPPAPKTDALALASAEPKAAQATQAEKRDYSVFPSLLPRQWLPIFVLSPGSAYLGGQVLGFDAVDRHRYLFGMAYDTQVKKPDWIALYSNRSLGPTFTFYGTEQTSELVRSTTSVFQFVRKTEFGANVAFPIRWTYSSLTPSIALEGKRDFLFEPPVSPDATSATLFVPNADVALAYSDSESSRLAISPERGRSARAAARAYLDSGGTRTYKGLLSHTEYLPLGGNAVAVPSARASWTSRRNDRLSGANVVLAGRRAQLADRFFDDSLDELAIRGYPGVLFLARAAAMFSLDLRFPLSPMFRGLGTLPVFLEQLWGFGFAETAYLPGARSVRTLPSAGGGLVLTTNLFYNLPVSISLEYHQGFRTAFAGVGELFLAVGYSGGLF